MKPAFHPSSLRILSVAAVALLLASCGGGVQSEDITTTIPPAKLYSAADTGGWTPDFSIINGSATGLEKGAQITKKSPIVVTAGMVGLNQAWGSKEVTVDLGHYDDQDFGTNGSMTLQAEVTGYPHAGGAYAVLTSFWVVKDSDSTSQEYVHLDSSCAGASSIWSCDAHSCSPSTTCHPVSGQSSFANLNDWVQHQFQAYGYDSVNSFPRCDASVNGWSCPSGLNTLPSGHYYAKYLLMSDSSGSVDSWTATLNVVPIVRQDATARGDADHPDTATNGAIDLNVVLVGDENISDSHTAKGAQNLNLLFRETHSLLKENAGIGIGDIKVYEWKDVDGGDFYSQISINQVGVMFASASQTFPASDEGKSINVFLVRAIDASDPDALYTVLGVSGGILGAPLNGTQTSGLAFSTYGQAGNGLLDYNPGCSGSGTCDRNDEDANFLEMGGTIAHELGHYLGLNHPSESASSAATQRHDQLTDTPTCAPRTSGGYSILDQRSCYQDTTTQASPLSGDTCQTQCDQANGGDPYYELVSGFYFLNHLCPSVKECQFNHTMWYTTKNHLKVGGVWVDDGNQFSPQSQAILQWSPFVR